MAAAQAIVSKLEQPVPFTVPSVGKPPAGKSVALITCTLPICASNLSVAAAKLHWSFKEFQWNPQGGPQAYGAAFDQALQSKPNYIIDIGIFPPATVSKEMAQAAASHIPVIAVTGLSNNPAIKSCVNCSYYLGLLGQRIADLAVAGGATGASTVSLGVPTNVGTVQADAGLSTELHRLHAGDPQLLNLSLQRPIAQNNSAVINYIESHPGTKAIVNTFADLTIGLPSALRQAGLSSKIKYYTSDPETPDINYIKTGQEAPAVAIMGYSAGWNAFNQVVALSLGKPAAANAGGWLAYITKDNVASVLKAAGTPTEANPPHFEQAYLKAWGLS